MDYWKKHGLQLEPELIAKNDLCVANSTFLAEYCGQFNPNSFDVGQGCDLDIFVENKRKEAPVDVAAVQGIVVGYVGALQSIRLDRDIIAHIASSRPEWTIILVGPEDELFKTSNLHEFENVLFTGAKPISELPDYINFFDVCINPQLINEITIGNYPRKIDEYTCYIGKPVVATATKTMETFRDFVYLAQNKEDYILLIEKALNENSEMMQEKRREFALEHTWENSVAKIYNALNNYSF
ncbi:hypothetical protein [Pedobacter sp. NJ-S-72]